MYVDSVGGSRIKFMLFKVFKKCLVYVRYLKMCVNDGLISCVCLKRKNTKEDFILMLYVFDVFKYMKGCYVEENMDVFILFCFKD